MNTAKIEALKQASEVAHAALRAETTRLTDLGLKSQARYEALKGLKATADAAHAEYSKFAKGQISKELDKIIAKQTPAQRAEGLRRARGGF